MRYLNLAVRLHCFPSRSVYSSNIILWKSRAASVTNEMPLSRMSTRWPTWRIGVGFEQYVIRTIDSMLGIACRRCATDGKKPEAESSCGGDGSMERFIEVIPSAILHS